jgi:glutamine cyclotransferase
MLKHLAIGLLPLVLASAGGVPEDAMEVLPHRPGTTLGQYEIVDRLPHAPDAFTQGLAFQGGYLYESTGLYGKSTLRRVDPSTGAVLKRVAIPDRYFAEGITILNDRIYLITWREGTCLVYDVASLEKVGESNFEGEGWGLTDDGKDLIRSDGTDVLRFHDPETFQVTRRIHVRENGVPVGNLNELEYIRGEIHAVVWRSDRIVRNDPESGAVTGSASLGHLFSPGMRPGESAGLNGIAYDRGTDRIYVTGKLWPLVFVFGK